MKIVIGSILKPLTDVRHYHKIALSLLKIPKSQVYILARNETDIPIKENLFFNAITSSSASITSRLSAPYKFLFYLFKVAPEVIIVCTHELLLPSLFYKWIRGCVLIYDVQENYGLNIISNLTYNPFLKKCLAFKVRMNEKLSSSFIDRFWLAEDCYKTELTFLSGKYDVFENKSLISKEIQPVSLGNKESVRLIFSGTIAKENGIEETLDLIDKLNKLYSGYSLSIAGCCHDVKLLRWLEKVARHKPFISLNISNKPVNYEEVIKEIQNADIGIVCYRQQENFRNKVPTKLYEYLSLGLPVILQYNEKWNKICSEFDAAVAIDFRDYKPEPLHQGIQERVFYAKSPTYPEELTWSSGEKHFMNSFLALLPK